MPQQFPPDTPEAWKARIIKELKDKPYESIISQTADGIEIQPFYTDEGKETILDSGPGLPWRVRQEFDDEHEDKNNLIHEALMAGVDSISLGTSDLKKDLDNVSVEIIEVEVGGEDVHARWTDFVAERGLEPKNLRGGYAWDPLGAMMITGRLEGIRDLPALLRSISAKIGDWKDWHCVHIQGDIYHNAGGTALQELGYTAALINEYIELEPALAHQMAVTLSASSDYFETASKIRAFYLMWANIMDTHGINARPKLFVRSSERELAPIDLHGNLLRGTVQCMAAAAGGSQQISLRPYDGIGGSFSYRLARNMQNLLIYESHIDKVVNPMKGAYLFEAMTESLATKAWERFKEVEKLGGWAVAAQSGAIQREVMDAAKSWASRLNSKEQAWLGVNLYPDKEELEWKGVDVQQLGEFHLPTIHHRIL